MISRPLRWPELKESQIWAWSSFQREKEIIFHGVKEDKDESAEEKTAKVKTYVNTFFETLEETEQTPSFIGRIKMVRKNGKRSANQDCFH